MAYGDYFDLPQDYLSTRIEDAVQQQQLFNLQSTNFASGSTNGEIAVYSTTSQGYAAGTLTANNGLGVAFSSAPFGLVISINNAATMRTDLGIDTIATKKSNLGASAAPTVNDDSGGGYAIGSIWVDTTADNVYMAVDVTVGAAVWRQLN